MRATFTRRKPGTHKPYPDPDRPGVYRVPLTRGREALIDAADVERASELLWKWDRHRKHGRAVWQGSGNSTEQILLTHHILGLPKGIRVSHRNDDTLDCRRANLRPGEQRLSARTQHKQANRSSVYKGVSKRPSGHCTAHIGVDGGHIYLGYFSDETAAARAYDDAAREHFGEYARLNFPSEEEPAHHD